MTTWQDETPTSRRALRERERAQSQALAETVPHSSDFSAVPPPRAQQGQAPSYRVRDYSPDARGSQFSTVGGPEPVAPTPTVPRGYRPESPETRVPGHAHGAPVAPEPIVEHTLTRRELRELREGAAAAANPGPPPHAPSYAAPTAEAPTPEAPTYTAPSPQAHSYTAPSYSAPAAPQPPPELVDPLEPSTHPAPSAPQAPSGYVNRAPSWQFREPEPAPDVVFVPQGAYAPPAPEFELAHDYAAPASHAPPVPAPVDQAAAFHADGVHHNSGAVADGRVRPEGHWSRQADLDDRIQLDDVLPGRDISRSDAITTSALVLPSMPQYPIGALSSTGEILVTGSIDLPRMLGATGIHPARFDASDFDSIMDAGDREDSHPNSAPVRAIRAVSTHTSTQGIMAAKRPRSKVPTILLAGFATVMGIGVVVLFVGGMLLDLF